MHLQFLSAIELRIALRASKHIHRVRVFCVNAQEIDLSECAVAHKTLEWMLVVAVAQHVHTKRHFGATNLRANITGGVDFDVIVDLVHRCERDAACTAFEYARWWPIVFVRQMDSQFTQFHVRCITSTAKIFHAFHLRIKFGVLAFVMCIQLQVGLENGVTIVADDFDYFQSGAVTVDMCTVVLWPNHTMACGTFAIVITDSRCNALFLFGYF